MSADSSAAAPCAGLSGPLLLASTQEIAIADVVRCGLIGAEVRAGLVAVEIPEPGNTITAAASTDDGDYAVTVAVDPNGDATIASVAPQKSLGLLAEPEVELGDEGTSALQNRCTDNRNALFGHKWFKDFNYWVNDTENLPSDISGGTFTTVVKDAAKMWQNGTNGCGVSVDVDRTNVWQGITTRNSNVNGPEGKCAKSGDGKNVVDFGVLPSGLNGISCTRDSWRVGLDIAQESDVRINKQSGRWTTTSSGCKGKIDLRGVVNHELGHTMGLAHVGNGDSALVMSTKRPACTFDRRTLGKGDVTGLKRLYG